MTTLRRRSAGVALCAGLVLSLSGCFLAEPQADIAVRSVRGTLQWAVCQDYSGNQLRVYTVPAKGDFVATTQWKIRGSINVTSGDEFTYGAAVDGTTVDVGPRTFTVKDSYVHFTVDQLDSRGKLQATIDGAFKGSAIGSKWLGADGATRNQACPNH